MFSTKLHSFLITLHVEVRDRVIEFLLKYLLIIVGKMIKRYVYISMLYK